MKQVLFLLTFLFPSLLFAQEGITEPQLIVFDKETKEKKALGLTEVQCEVEVTGNRLLVTYYMTFYNPFDRDFEGMLSFPLGEGENVVRFALDVNGILREGVVVEKNKGQQVFEEIENRRVDPGLLERVGGNNYRARVYPVPARGSKKMAIGYEKMLSPKMGEDKLVSIPCVFKQVIKKFKIKVSVYNGTTIPVIETNPDINITFGKWKNAYVAEKEMTDFNANTVLKFKIPVPEKEVDIFTTKKKNSSDYFFSASVYPEFALMKKVKSESPVIVWDASLSGLERNVEKELELLQYYISEFKDGEISVYVFNIGGLSGKEFKIKKGDPKELIDYLKSVPFDGATELYSVDLSVFKSREILFFTDGISTIGKPEVKTGECRIIPVVSSPSCDYSYLRFLATKSGGELINIAEGDLQKAKTQLSNKSFRFIGYESSVPLKEVYQDLSVTNQTAFTVSGIAPSSAFHLELKFGYGEEVSITKKIEIKPEHEVPADAKTDRVWALQKLRFLELMPDRNEDEIINHSTEWAVVSPYTSLIVLETVEDYIRYKIVPPADLQTQYFAAVEKEQKVELANKNKRVETVLAIYQKKMDWWKVDYRDTIKRVENEIIRKNMIKKLERELDSLRNTRTTLNNQLREVNDRIDYYTWRVDSLKHPDKYQMTYRKKTENDYMAKSIVNMSESTKMVLSESNAMMRESLADRAVAVREESPFDFSNSSQSYQRNKRNSIELTAWDPETPYMKELKAEPEASQYSKYLQLREEYFSSAAFYLDVSDFFFKQKKPKEARIILSNLAEIKNEDYTLLRILAHRMVQINELEYAIKIFQKVKTLRAEEPQSYRDLGLAYARNKQYQEAINELYYVIEHDWNDRFPEIEAIVLTEINNIISTCAKNLDLSKMDPRLIFATPVEIRIVLNWDTDYCDIDLHVKSPDGQDCYYGKPLSRIGGRLSRDFTGGYGPEEFMAKVGMKGDYTIEINYFGSRSTSVAGPTTVIMEVYTNYGLPNENRQEITRRLESAKETIVIGTVKIE